MNLSGMKRIPLFCLLSFPLLLGNVWADSPTIEAEQTQVEESAATDDGTVLQPREPSSRMFDSEHSDKGLVWAIYLFLLMLAVLLGLWVYSRKGGLNLKRPGISNELKIRETKALGNRQFLVVVEYGQQKMLIGVAPGVINHLCYLEDSSAEENPEAEA